LLAGFAAGVIDIATRWLSDLKSGYCRGHLYLNQEQCCWSDNDHGIDEDNCTAWHDYGNPNTYGGHVLLFIMYCLMGTLFATIAVILVKMIAPYACGSGIPEVKTILSGFIMKGYLGFGTLLVKTLTMPLAVSAGLMLGKEGPLVHVACCCGHAVAQFFPKYRNNQVRIKEKY
jgi:chloride channel 3/4/5